MSNPTTFSYAAMAAAKIQPAAKVQPAIQSAVPQPNATPSQTSSVAGSQSRESTTAASTSTRAPSVAVSTTSNDVDTSRSVRSASVKPEASGSNVSEAGSKSDQGATSAPVAEPSNPSSRAAEQARPGNATRALNEPRGRTSNPNSEVADNAENKKDGSPGPAPKVELTEARIPEVNIWVQRQAQAAKTKPTTDPTPRTTSTVGSSGPRQANTDPKQRLVPSQAVESNATVAVSGKGIKKDGEPLRNGGNQGPRRAGPRGSRAQEKESENMNLLANNSTSWPTPETAAVNSKPAPPSQADKDDHESTATKSKSKKEWSAMAIDYTTAYQTPVPIRGGRGGRVGGGRNGRDGAGSSHAAATASDRAQETGSGARSNSGPKRAPTEGSGHREGRKGVSQGEQSKAPKESVPDHAIADQSRPNGVVNGTTHQQPVPRASTAHQRPEDNGAKGSESHKDVRTQGNRDSHHSGQSNTNHRGERTRGGGRGRGGFSNQNNANGMSHHPQQPYMPPNAYYQQAGSRQMPQYMGAYPPTMAYAGTFPNQSGSGHRRPGSMSNGRGAGPSRVANGRMSTLPPMSMPYDQMYHPANGNMFAMEQGFGQPELYQNVQRQMEYYFSSTNLAQDFHLRRHMDSQGFVDINLFATFPRISTMTNNDISLLVSACMGLPVLDTIVCDDNAVRVRNKEEWQQWVIKDWDSRDVSARHAGPQNWHHMAPVMHSMMSPSYPVEQPPMFSPTQEHGFGGYSNGYPLTSLAMPNINGVNGVNGHALPHESQLSATVPEFSPATASGFSAANDSNGVSDTLKKTASKDTTLAEDESVNTSNGVAHLANGVTSTHETNGQ